MRLLLPTLVLLALTCATPGSATAGRHALPDSVAAPDTLRRIVPIAGVEVNTTRLGERAPQARAVLTREELVRQNTGLDTGMLLGTLPGAYAYSDAGNGIGYSYLSIRGFPQRRISVLVDGVPLNDPESNEVYWIDHPDLLASTSSAQLQRGVGSALYGGASVGGSVDLETAPLSDAPSARATLACGSWATRRLALEEGSGNLAGGWNFYGRYSRIETQGYREQSWSRLWSYLFAARRTLGDHVLRLTLFGGPEETHLAYRGASAGELARDRRFNPLDYAGEQDHFFEPHYQLVHSWAPRSGLAFSQTLFWFDGKGYYDERRSADSLAAYRLEPWSTADESYAPGTYLREWVRTSETDSVYVPVRDPVSGRLTVVCTDVVRRRTVTNRHYGWVPRLRVEHAGGTLTAGGELRAHDSRHQGEVLWGSSLPPGSVPDHAYYDYRPRTFAAALFVREEWRAAPRVLVTGDLAWRHQGYHMGGDPFEHITFDRSYDFALPRLGVTVTPRAGLAVFAAWSASRREPAFRNLFDAEQAGSQPLFRDGAPISRPERVNDFELGAAWRSSRATASVNLFRMDFRDELVDYQFNSDFNNWITVNAARSVHQGIELAGRVEAAPGPRTRLALDGNATFSDNHFVSFTDVQADGYEVRQDGRTIGFFPEQLANLDGRATWRGITCGLTVQVAGRMYLDNGEAASIPAHTRADALAACSLPAGSANRAELTLRVVNLFDARYSTGGYWDYDSAGDYLPLSVPAATRSWLTQVSIGF
jgi:iron complex outermembrane recepter protein